MKYVLIFDSSGSRHRKYLLGEFCSTYTVDAYLYTHYRPDKYYSLVELRTILKDYKSFYPKNNVYIESIHEYIR